jgi:hypothetical protein
MDYVLVTIDLTFYLCVVLYVQWRLRDHEKKLNWLHQRLESLPNPPNIELLENDVDWLKQEMENLDLRRDL